MTDLADTANWLPLNGLEPGFDANKAEPSTALADREVVVTDDRGTRITHRFGAGTVGWDYVPGATDPLPAATGKDHYEAFDVAEGLVYAQFHHTHEPAEAVSLFLDFTTGHTLSVITTIAGPEPGRTRVRQAFVPGHLDGTPVSGPAPAPTTALIGRRALWVYSEEHAYEHVYLSPQWYTWQCLAGPERGLADTDENTVYQLRPGIYVFTWREKVIPCAASPWPTTATPTTCAPTGRCSAWTRPAGTPRTSPSARSAACSAPPSTPPTSTRHFPGETVHEHVASGCGSFRQRLSPRTPVFRWYFGQQYADGRVGGAEAVADCVVHRGQTSAQLLRRASLRHGDLHERHVSLPLRSGPGIRRSRSRRCLRESVRRR